MRVEGGGDDPGSRSAALADPGTLRRLELLAVAWTVVGAAGFFLAGAPSGALVLTGASALSIVAFRGLQRIVSALQPEERAGRRPGLAALVRFAVLFGLLAAGALLLDPEYFPAIVLGFSTLPASLISEGLYQAARSIRGRDHHDDVP
ncbi:MAG TPA: hypothetical protein VLF66_15665 [Thermoanaerobaculia bacterium]|nr:hypothetical protein [Thermoanaerobaculia bacterium]